MDKPKYKIDKSKLTPEQQDKLDVYYQTQDQLKTLQDLADMTHELVNLATDTKENTGKLEALGAVLTDAREQLIKLNEKEAPDAPDYAKPIVGAIYKLETALKAQKAPQVNIAAPNVDVAAPDLTEFNRLLRTEIPKAFDKAIKSIPKVEVSPPDNSELLKAWEGIAEQLTSIDTATRMKPIQGTMKVTNADGTSVRGTEYADGAARTTATGTIAMVDDGTNIQSLSGDSTGKLNVNNISGTVTLPTGAATSALQSTQDTSINTLLKPASTLTAVTTVGTVTNLSQQSGVAISIGTGVRDAGTQRVTIATNDVVPITDNSGSLTVDAPVATPVFVRLSDGAAAISTLPVSLTSTTVTGTVTTKETRSTTNTTATVAGSATVVTLIASNANRLGGTVYNDSTAILYVKLGATASLSDFTVALSPLTSSIGGYFEVPFAYTGIITGIWASATGNARVGEIA